MVSLESIVVHFLFNILSSRQFCSVFKSLANNILYSKSILVKSEIFLFCFMFSLQNCSHCLPEIIITCEYFNTNEHCTLYSVQWNTVFLGGFLQPTEAYGFNTLFIQYYSVICRPSDHTVGRPRAEI